MALTSVNRRTNPYVMKDIELWDAVNFWTERAVGSKKVRPGYSLFMDRADTSPVRGFAYAKFPNGYKRLARFSGTKMYAVDPNTASVWGTALLTASNAFLRPDYTTFAAKVHIVDKDATSLKYLEWVNSAGADTVTVPTYASGTELVIPYKSAAITTFHRRVYVGHTYYSPNEYGSRIGWSSLEYANKGTDPASPWTSLDTDTTSANYRNIDTDYKGDILKITNINDRLNIYKEGGIYRYNETAVFDIFGLSPVQGSIATMEETKEDYFFTNEGFFKTNGTESSPIGTGWYPIIKEILKNGVTASKMHSHAVNFLYFCYMGDVTYDKKTITNACFVYNALYDELSLWSFGHDITAIGHYTNSSNDKIVVLGDVNGYTYKLDYTANDDAGTPIQARMHTKYFWFGGETPEQQSQMSKMFVFSTLGSEVQILADRDFLNEPKELGSVSGTEKALGFGYEKLNYFRNVSVEFVWNGKGTRPEIYGVILMVKGASERDVPDKEHKK